MANKIRIGKVFLTIFNVLYGMLSTLLLAIGVYLARKHYILIQKLKKYEINTAKLILDLDYAVIGDDLLCIVVLVAGAAAVFLILFNLFSIYTKNTYRLRIIGLTLTILCAIKLTIGCLFLITAQYPTEHDCCGVVNYTDYINLNMYQEPESCYKRVSESDIELKRDGCAKKIKDYYMSRIRDIGLVCLAVGSLEVFGPISTFYLANALRRPTSVAAV